VNSGFIFRFGNVQFPRSEQKLIFVDVHVTDR
jgi:hypothetical protein